MNKKQQKEFEKALDELKTNPLFLQDLRTFVNRSTQIVRSGGGWPEIDFHYSRNELNDLIESIKTFTKTPENNEY